MTKITLVLVLEERLEEAEKRIDIQDKMMGLFKDLIDGNTRRLELVEERYKYLNSRIKGFENE